MIRRIAMDATLPSQEELLPAPYFNGHSVEYLWVDPKLSITGECFPAKL